MNPQDKLIQKFVTIVVTVIASLTFAFGFGNGAALGLRLGVSGWIAPLVAPAVDLSVMALLVVLHHVRSQRTATQRLVAIRLLLGFCGLVTLALNTTFALVTGAYGRALFDAVAPLLLIGWSEVAPRVLELLHQAAPDSRPASVPQPPAPRPRETADGPRPSVDLLRQAADLDLAHMKASGRPLTRDELRRNLQISNAMASAVLKALRDAKP
jgi:hypothetical protein